MGSLRRGISGSYRVAPAHWEQAARFHPNSQVLRASLVRRGDHRRVIFSKHLETGTGLESSLGRPHLHAREPDATTLCSCEWACEESLTVMRERGAEGPRNASRRPAEHRQASEMRELAHGRVGDFTPRSSSSTASRVLRDRRALGGAAAGDLAEDVDDLLAPAHRSRRRASPPRAAPRRGPLPDAPHVAAQAKPRSGSRQPAGRPSVLADPEVLLQGVQAPQIRTVSPSAALALPEGQLQRHRVVGGGTPKTSARRRRPARPGRGPPRRPRADTRWRAGRSSP